MFVDTAKIKLFAGKGGDGAVSFRHEIYIPKGGPDGGDGGRGGSIIFRADKDTNTLLDFRFNPELHAENGKNGAGSRSAGRSGKDLIVEVPIGTVVKRDGEIIADLTKDKEEAIIARGGDGGFGNAHFKSSTRQTPVVAEVGEPGEEFEAELELKLLADVGLVGLPNAGKSTFLSVVSNARPEIADYPFTTLTPNLGVATIDGRDLLIADIPGLIEGASEGKGLGHAFLRHIDRTAVLLHLVDVYNDDAGKAYKTVRLELEKYSDLASRPEVVGLTKCEGLDPEIIEMQTASILAENPSARVLPLSSSAHEGLEGVLRELKNNIEANSSFDAAKENPRLFDGEYEGEQSMAGVSRSALRAERLFDDKKPTGFSEARKNLLADYDRKRAFDNALPVISLSKSAIKTAWHVEKLDDRFLVTGEKIEKFARRTDLSNYASVNRLRDIMKKLGIRAELTSLGAAPDSIISIAGKDFTLVEE